MKSVIKIGKDKIIFTLLFILFPLFSVIGIIYNIIKKDKLFYYILLSVWIGYFWYFFIPDSMMDLYRHYERFENIFNVDRYQVTNSYYFGLDFLNYFLKKNNLRKEIIVFLSSSIFYGGLGYAFYIFTEKVKIKSRYKIILLIIFFLSFGIIIPTYVRTPIAVGFFIVALIKVFYLDKKIGIVYALLSIAFHSALTFPVVIFLIIYLFKIDNFLNSKKKVILYLITCFLIGKILIRVEILSNILSGINSFLPNNMRLMAYDTYLNGRWGASYYEDIKNTGSFQNYIALLIMGMKNQIFCLYSLFIKKKPTSIERKIWLFSGINLLYINFFSFYQRYSFIVNGMIFLIILRDLGNRRKSKFYITLFILYNLFVIFVEARIYYMVFVNSLSFEYFLPFLYLIIR